MVLNGLNSDFVPIMSGVPQGSVLGPLMFHIYINDIFVGVKTKIRLFAGDCVLYGHL